MTTNKNLHTSEQVGRVVSEADIQCAMEIGNACKMSYVDKDSIANAISQAMQPEREAADGLVRILEDIADPSCRSFDKEHIHGKSWERIYEDAASEALIAYRKERG